MDPLEQPRSPETPKKAQRSTLRRWLLLAGVLVLALIAASVVLSRGGGTRQTDRRAATVALPPAEIAQAVGGDPDRLVRVNPPIDIDAIESAARNMPFLDVPMPDSRYIESFRRTDTGQEITQAFLLYDNEEDAARVDALANQYLASALGLSTEPIDLPGTEEARVWRGKGYEAVSFRLDGVFALVATTETGDPDSVMRLAERARQQAAEARPTLEAGATLTAAAATSAASSGQGRSAIDSTP